MDGIARVPRDFSSDSDMDDETKLGNADLSHFPKPDGAAIPASSSSASSQDQPILVRGKKDIAEASKIMAALPTSRKEMAKVYKKVAGIKCEKGECVAMVDSGSFIHAIDAEEELPGHPIQWFTEEEANRNVAETACGGILKRLGKVNTLGSVDDVPVDITWNHMRVKCPILSVVRLTKDGNEVWIRRDGGEIVNKASGKRLKFFEHNGVYYMKIKIETPSTRSSESSSVFTRQV